MNLYELIKINNYQGFSYSLIKRFAHSILQCLVLFSELEIIHCDLKPVSPPSQTFTHMMVLMQNQFAIVAKTNDIVFEDTIDISSRNFFFQENILLQANFKGTSAIKVIDVGSSCFVGKQGLYVVLSTRFHIFSHVLLSLFCCQKLQTSLNNLTSIILQ